MYSLQIHKSGKCLVHVIVFYSIVTKWTCVCLTHREKQTKILESGAEKRLLQGRRRSWAACVSQSPDSLSGFSKALLKARLVRGMISCCKVLGVGILCSCICPHRSDYNVPVNFQQDGIILCPVTFYLCMNGLLKVRALTRSSPVLFQAIGNILLQKMQSQPDYAQATGTNLICR